MDRISQSFGFLSFGLCEAQRAFRFGLRLEASPPLLLHLAFEHRQLPLKHRLLLNHSLYMPRYHVPLGIDELILYLVTAQLTRHVSHLIHIVLDNRNVLLHHCLEELVFLTILDFSGFDVIVADLISTAF